MKVGIIATVKPAPTNIRYTSTTEQEIGKTNGQNKEVNAKQTLAYLAATGTVIAGGLIALTGTKKKVSQSVDTLTQYLSKIATSLANATGKEISPENLSCLMNKSEFIEAISKLKKENYIPSAENIEKGIFRADLHSHSVFSDGKASVETILEQVRTYADKLYATAEEKFIFALTDHDTAEGVKKALEIISKNPEKFKNVRFVTGSEVSYLIKSDKTTNPYETSELLVYGFNPYSKNVEQFFENVKNRRLLARENYIKDLSEQFPDTKFSQEEFLKVYLGENNSHIPIMNSFWQLFHYGQLKKVLSDTAKSKNLNPEEYFKETMSKVGKDRTLNGLKKLQLVENWISDNPEIIKINEKYKPTTDADGNIIKTSENTIDDIVAGFGDEEECSMGFAHPYYITERNSDFQSIINKVIDKLGEKLNLTESYHQAYSPKILQDENDTLHKVSQYIEGKGLLPIGGRDNHKQDFLII